MADERSEDLVRRVAANERIVALDVLRGMAILGILIMNIPIMGGYFQVEPSDPRLVSWTLLDQIAFRFVGTVLDGTQRGLLELLFGAGVMIMTRSAMTPDGPVATADLHYRRNLWLMAFGVFQALVLLWPGDILLAYGFAALFLFPLRTLAPRWKVALAIVCMLAAIAPAAQRYHERSGQKAAAVAAEAKLAAKATLTKGEQAKLDAWREKAASYAPVAQNPKKQAAMEKERKTRLGPLTGYSVFLMGIWTEFNFSPSSFYSMGEIFGTMLLGMALFQWGVIQGRSKTAVYVTLLVVGYGAGMPLRWLADNEALRFTPDPKIGWLTWDVARMGLVLGHLSLVHLLLRTRAGAAALSVFQAPGRMPLTIYLSASVICMWGLFPGVGLGLFGRFGWAGLTGIALAIMAAQLVFANLWMRAFESGPIDWLWKSLAYQKDQPWRRQSSSKVISSGPAS